MATEILNEPGLAQTQLPTNRGKPIVLVSFLLLILLFLKTFSTFYFFLSIFFFIDFLLYFLQYSLFPVNTSWLRQFSFFTDVAQGSITQSHMKNAEMMLNKKEKRLKDLEERYEQQQKQAVTVNKDLQEVRY